MEEENERLRIEIAQLKTQTTPLTFANLLAVCHDEIGEVRVEGDSLKCTVGTLGYPPKGRLLPIALRS